MNLKNTWFYKGLRRKLKKLLYDIKNRVNERTFTSNGATLKYLYLPQKQSDVLLVGFSGCFEGGAIYNYVGSCSKFKINKLFIKDDFAANHRGCYYIGSNNNFNVERSVIELINSIKEKTQAKSLIFIGTSKGAYAALNFALHYDNANIICGAPQYYVADYLISQNFKVNLEEILGSDNINSENISKLNNRLKNKILNSANKNLTINIMYSNKEHTYAEHIKDLLTDLKTANFTLIEQVESFPNHGDIGKHFPQYLKSKLAEVLQ